jgi:phosphate transport system protein
MAVVHTDARMVQHEDDELDQLEIEVDEIAMRLLSKAPLAGNLRFITAVMRISHDLERVGDEATKIARRTVELRVPPRGCRGANAVTATNVLRALWGTT